MKAKIELVFPKNYEKAIWDRVYHPEDVIDNLKESIEKALPNFKVKVLEVK